jgi:hypothetical protein
MRAIVQAACFGFIRIDLFKVYIEQYEELYSEIEDPVNQ